MFINLTNHPSAKWSESQRKAAEEYGEIVDMGFPDIDSKMSSEEVKRFAMDYVKKIMEKEPKCVLCQGGIYFFVSGNKRVDSERDKNSGGLQRKAYLRDGSRRCYKQGVIV